MYIIGMRVSSFRKQVYLPYGGRVPVRLVWKKKLMSQERRRMHLLNCLVVDFYRIIGGSAAWECLATDHSGITQTTIIHAKTTIIVLSQKLTEDLGDSIHCGWTRFGCYNQIKRENKIFELCHEQVTASLCHQECYPLAWTDQKQRWWKARRRSDY